MHRGKLALVMSQLKMFYHHLLYKTNTINHTHERHLLFFIVRKNGQYQQIIFAKYFLLNKKRKRDNYTYYLDEIYTIFNLYFLSIFFYKMATSQNHRCC